MTDKELKKATRRAHIAARRRMVAEIQRNNGTYCYVPARFANPFCVVRYLTWKEGHTKLA